ncbi:hypothetical protein U1Q18_007945, partial [Sarracenia purpurea var. burkii]
GGEGGTEAVFPWWRRWGSPVPTTVRESHKDHRSLSHFRSLSWRVSQSWSAARRLQVIGNNLAAPGSNEIVATSGLAVTAFTLNSVSSFCDEGSHACNSLPGPRASGLFLNSPAIHLGGAGSVASLEDFERIEEEGSEKCTWIVEGDNPEPSSTP